MNMLSSLTPSLLSSPSWNNWNRPECVPLNLSKIMRICEEDIDKEKKTEKFNVRKKKIVKRRKKMTDAYSRYHP